MLHWHELYKQIARLAGYRISTPIPPFLFLDRLVWIDSVSLPVAITSVKINTHAVMNVSALFQGRYILQPYPLVSHTPDWPPAVWVLILWLERGFSIKNTSRRGYLLTMKDNTYCSIYINSHKHKALKFIMLPFIKYTK